MPFNLVGLTDAEVRASLTQMAQTMTVQVNRQYVQRENPPVRSIADKLRDFTRMNPHILKGSKTIKDPQAIVDKVHNILVAMGTTDIHKAKIAISTSMLHGLGARCGKIVVSRWSVSHIGVVQ